MNCAVDETCKNVLKDELNYLGSDSFYDGELSFSDFIVDKTSLKIYTNRDKINMNNSRMNLIKDMITNMPYGSVFVVSDFTNFVKYENAKKCLMRLEKEGIIRRIIRGIYDKPYYSKLLNEWSSPNIDFVAAAIARSFNWKISPSGITALNLLGLSTQVVNSYEYNSSGQYKSYEVGNITIEFKHKSSKELLDLSYKTSLVVNAIKEIGPKIDEKSISIIKSNLSTEESKVLLSETSRVTKWIYEIIKKICN